VLATLGNHEILSESVSLSKPTIFLIVGKPIILFEPLNNEKHDPTNTALMSAFAAYSQAESIPN